MSKNESFKPKSLSVAEREVLNYLATEPANEDGEGQRRYLPRVCLAEIVRSFSRESGKRFPDETEFRAAAVALSNQGFIKIEVEGGDTFIASIDSGVLADFVEGDPGGQGYVDANEEANTL